MNFQTSKRRNFSTSMPRHLNEIDNSALPLDCPRQQAGLGKPLQHLVELMLQHLVELMLQHLVEHVLLSVAGEDEANGHPGKTGHRISFEENQGSLEVLSVGETTEGV